MANYHTLGLDEDDEMLISQVVRSITPEYAKYPPEDQSEKSPEQLLSRRPRKFAVYSSNSSNFEKSEDGCQAIKSNKNVHGSEHHTGQFADESWLVHVQELQTSLENAMIENNDLKHEIKALKDAATEHSTVNLYVEHVEESDSIRATTIEVTSGESDWENIILEDGNDVNKEPKNNPNTQDKSSNIQYRMTFKQFIANVKMTIITLIWNFLSDFTCDSNDDQIEYPEKEEDYSIGRMIDNIKRVQNVVKPYVKASEKVNQILTWENRSTALIVGVSLFMSALTGYTVQLAILVPIYKLTVNYLIVSGLAERFKLFQQKEEEEDEESQSLGDKVTLVKTILNAIQNIAKLIADNMEKLENLMWWHKPEVTSKLYSALWVMFFTALFLPSSLILSMLGMIVVLKIFVVNATFAKYPKVKARYDNMTKLWKSLPTHDDLAKLEKKQISSSINISLKDSQKENEDKRNRDELKDKHIKTKFGLSDKEKIHPNWRDGKKCNQIYRGSLLAGHKAGKLYLTNAHICYEKANSVASHDKFIIKLNEVKSIVKCKPFLILPGSGMSIELFMNDEKSYLFSTIFNRDKCYKEIIELGLHEGYNWAIEK